MSAASTLARGRAAAVALMVDTCTVRRITSTTTNPDTGHVTPVYATVYTGACKVQARSGSGSPSTLGEAGVIIAQMELHVPMSVTGVQPDDLVTITASVHDPDLVGRTWHIRGLAHKSYLTARRLSMVEVTG